MQGGVAGTDVASLCNCAARSEEDCYWLLAKKISMQVMQTLRAEIKREEKQMRKQAEMVQGSPEWHSSRHGSIGGTEAAALVGAAYRDSKNLSAAKRLWEEKIGELKGEGYESPAMKQGKALEPVARKQYETLMDWSATPLCVLHDQYDFIRASLDGLRQDDGLVLEIKCPFTTKNHYKFAEISSYREDPFYRHVRFAEEFNYYRTQVQWQLLITGSPVTHFVSYSEQVERPEDRLVLIELYPEPDLQQVLLERAIEFWGFVERREFPPESWLKPCHFPPRNVLVP